MQLISVVPDPDADREPTAAELAAIEADLPVLAAETALWQAQLAAERRPTSRAVRRVRRAVVRLLAAHRERAGSPQVTGLTVSGWGWAR